MKKRTGKILAFALAAVLTTANFTGCSIKKNATVDGKTVISVNRYPDKTASPDSFAVLEKRRTEFMEKNPDIIVNGDQSAYDVQTYLAQAAGGTLPTLYNTFLTEAKKIYELGYCAPVTDQIKKFGFEGKLNEDILDMITFDGEVYYLPENVYTLGIVVNLDVYKEAGFVDADGNLTVPETFEELAEISKTIKEKTGKAGFVMPTTENCGGWIFMPIAWNYGATFMEKVDGKWKSTFDSSECIAALDYLKKMKWEDESLPDSTLINATEAIKLVGTGQAAMTIAHPGQLNSFHSYGLNNDSVGMMKMPAGPKKHVTLLGGGLHVFNGDATEAQLDACFKWLQYGGYTDKLTEDAKKNIEDGYKLNSERGNVIGVRDLSIWSDDAERQEFINSMVEKYRNVNPNHFKSYNDKNIDFQFEEPVCTQDLYKLLDGCIQEVLTNKNADSKVLLKEASKTFQESFLNYEN